MVVLCLQSRRKLRADDHAHISLLYSPLEQTDIVDMRAFTALASEQIEGRLDCLDESIGLCAVQHTCLLYKAWKQILKQNMIKDISICFVHFPLPVEAKP